jgi:threonine synthase
MAIGVEDEFILEAMKDLARTTGIFCEPTGATSLAAVRRLFAQGHIARDAVVVCIVTGHGFKDFAAWKF